MEPRAANIRTTSSKLAKINLHAVEFLEKINGSKKILATTFPGLFGSNIPNAKLKDDNTEAYLYLNTPAAIRKRNENFELMIKSLIDEVLEIKKMLDFYLAEMKEYIEIVERESDKYSNTKNLNEVSQNQSELERSKALLNQLESMKKEVQKLLVQLTIQEQALKTTINLSISNVVDVYVEKMKDIVNNFIIPSDGQLVTDFLNQIIKDSKSEIEAIPDSIDKFLNEHENVTMNDLDDFASDAFEKIIREKVSEHSDSSKYDNVYESITKARKYFQTILWNEDIKNYEIANNNLRVKQISEQQLAVNEAAIGNLNQLNEALTNGIDKFRNISLENVSLPQAQILLVNQMQESFKAISNVANNNIKEVNTVNPRMMSLSEKLKAARAKTIINPSPESTPPSYAESISKEPKIKPDKTNQDDHKPPVSQNPDPDDNPEDGHRPIIPGRR